MEIKVVTKEQPMSREELEETTKRLHIRFHKGIAETGRWFEFSYNEQMGNIGSEVGRAARAQKEGGEKFRLAGERALELFDLTFADQRWRKKGTKIEY